MVRFTIMTAAIATSAFVLALALFYTPERRWMNAILLGDKAQFEPLSIALPKCLKENDPAGFREFNETGSYRLSGWFLPERPEGNKVRRCMRFKGWFDTPTHLYSL